MGKLFINATKSYGQKIKNAIVNANGRIDGVHYSLADICIGNKEDILNSKVSVFPELPLYYLTKNNTYLTYFFDRKSIELENGKLFTPTENNNKLICLEGHIDFSFLTSLPLTSMEYSANREKIMKMVGDFYTDYYKDKFLMTPTFTFDKVSTWEDVMLSDILNYTSDYLSENMKENVILSILLDPVLLDTSNVAQTLINYVDKFKFIDGISISIINDDSMYYYSKDQYKDILSFLKELKNNNLEVYLQYCGIKDIVFSVLDINRFSVGWFGSYRNFDTNSKGISEISINGFGKRVKKILSMEYMTELPLSYLEVLSEEDFYKNTEIKKSESETIGYTDLEQIYFREMLKIIEKNEEDESNYFGDELISKRCDNLIEILDNSIINLEVLIDLLKKNGRFSDATKVDRYNLEYTKIYKSSLEAFQKKLFF